jgi:hypothetical protein
MDDIAAQRQRLNDRMARIDAERLKVTEELGELDAAERVLSRFTAAKPGRRGRGKGAQNANAGKQPQSSAARRITPRGERKHAKQEVPLREATLRAVKALGKEASADQIRGYLGRKFGMQVRPLHLGRALQSHRRAGRLEQRDERWSMAQTQSGEAASA